MRLLAKKDASVETQKQKKALIDEGVKLASTVDALRETKVQEEGNVERFRKNTLTVIQREVDSAIGRRDAIRAEVKELEKELALQKLPLDPEWEKIRLAYIKYADQIDSLEAAKETVAQQIGENTMLAHELEVEKGKIQDMKSMTEERLQRADNDLQAAREESSRLRNTGQLVLASAEARERAVVQREHDYQNTVDWVEKETARVELLESDIAKREKILTDRYATLERTIKRMKKK